MACLRSDKTTKPASLFLYDVTSSYMEGAPRRTDQPFATISRWQKRAAADCHWLTLRRDGHPVSIEVFPGNYHPVPLLRSLKGSRAGFGVTAITFVGDQGMIKGQQVEDLARTDYHYITAITKHQIDKLLRTGTLQMDLLIRS